MKRIFAATTALLGVMVAQNAWAATVTTSMGATAGVGAACAAVTSTSLAFHTVTTLVESDSIATVTTNCTLGAGYDIGMGLGANPAGLQRQLTGIVNTNLVNYGIFQNVGHSIPWGTTFGVDTVTLVGTGANQTTTVYGQIPSGQTVASDQYSDTILITVTY
jgi:spore coat protein U-like protein